MNQAAAQPEVRRPMPAWLSVLLILLCVSSGVWIMHWYITTDPLKHESHILDANPSSPSMMGRPGRGQNNFQAPIRQQGDNWVVRSSEATVIFGRSREKAVQVHSINYNSYEFVPDDQRQMIFAARRIVKDEAVAKALAVTAQQMKELHPLTQMFTMAVEPADLDRLKKMWSDYESNADRTSAQSTLLDAINDVAHKSLDATLAAANARAEKIKAVLTEEQWKQFSKMGQ